MLRLIAAALVICASIATASAQPVDVTDEEALVLRTKTFIGRRVTLKGWMTAADEISAQISLDAGRLGMKSINFKWPKKEGALYEQGNLICGGLTRVNSCRIDISGVVIAYPDFPDSFYLDQTEVQWVK